MNKLIVAIVLSVTSACLALDTRCVVINSTNDVAALAAVPEWRRGVDTNGVMIAVCVGGAVIDVHGTPLYYPLSRELEFDSEGRLIRASPISYMQGLTRRINFQPKSIEKTLLDSLYRSLYHSNPESVPPDVRRHLDKEYSDMEERRQARERAK